MPITVGGWALAQVPKAQSALVSLDPLDGAITSLVGGLDFSLSKFNRASQALRQPGSAFKPFIYAAALAMGNTLSTIVLDAPVVINSTALEQLWRPVNYSGRFYGAQRVREGLVKSMNLLSVRLLLNNTGIGNTVRYLKPFGFSDGTLIRNGSLALGGGDASPLDIAQAYATFANGGYAVKPYVIDSIFGPTEELLYRAEPFIVCPNCEPGAPTEEAIAAARVLQNSALPTESTGADNANDNLQVDTEFTFGDKYDSEYDTTISLERMAVLGESYKPDATIAPGLFTDVKVAERIISPQIAFLIQDAMREVVRRGTAVRANALGRRDLSGKTGTSNDRRDAWFAGFNSKTVGIVWVGYDDSLPLGPREEGSRTALPIWIEFMRIALRGVPESRMDMPAGIVTVRISRTTGCPASATHAFEDVMFEHYREDSVPECENVETQQDIFNTGEEPEDDEKLF
jgi:penicillin-binding protein 1A